MRRALEADSFQTSACWWLSVVTLTGIAETTGLYKSAVLRMMVTLERRGREGRPQDQRMGLGPLGSSRGRANERSNRHEVQLESIDLTGSPM